MKSYAWENKVLVKLVSMISALAAVVCLGLFTGCTGGAAGGDITVVSRESGSGTRAESSPESSASESGPSESRTVISF